MKHLEPALIRLMMFHFERGILCARISRNLDSKTEEQGGGRREEPTGASECECRGEEFRVATSRLDSTGRLFSSLEFYIQGSFRKLRVALDSRGDISPMNARHQFSSFRSERFPLSEDRCVFLSKLKQTRDFQTAIFRRDSNLIVEHPGFILRPYSSLCCFSFFFFVFIHRGITARPRRV